MDNRPRPEKVEELYRVARQMALDEVEKRAREALRARKDLKEFLMAMGTACFYKKRPRDQMDNLSVDEVPEAQALAEWLDEWDDAFKLTGTPMRFIADGPVVTDW